MTTRNAASMGTFGASWEAAGYAGQGNVAGLIGSLKGRSALVAGNAAGVFEEVAAVQAAIPDAVIFAANDVGIYLPKVDHWVSLHSDHLGPWKQVRWLHAKEKEETKYHGESARPFVDYVWEGLCPLFCLSGYFAMQIAYLMGASPIILCGCPGTATKRFFEAAPRADFGYGSGENGSDRGVREQLIKEMDRLPAFRAAVRSCSGWTANYFGCP